MRHWAVCASIWSCPAEGVMSFSAYSVLSFCRNHYLLQLFGRPQWLTVRWRSHDYVNKVREQLESRDCQIRTGCGVHSVSTIDDGCLITCEDGSQETYNGCIMATHAPDALKILGKQATYDEMRILGAFQYVYSDVFLHCDKNLMPKNPAAWTAWNFLGAMDNKVCVTYWLNVLQNLCETGLPYLVTLNPSHTPEHTLLKWSTGHPFPSVAASKASFELDHIQGKRGIWFCGAYQGEFVSLLLDWDDVHSVDFCLWRGVFCDNVTLSVVSLNLSNLNLGRELSPAIRDLKNLRFMCGCRGRGRSRIASPCQ
ncbi:uncharacterized protein LOC114273282 isoform X2 [Camellia sinensis]|uniref:uncharacterized protein LOC114273282 isoform X2 n=1 Tax=Camellia sinensis TaxID=4442 RepID=UPI001036AC33|nr:uncharacterized protein LOC114273282 isoform X2 [Camellia sinensis]